MELNGKVYRVFLIILGKLGLHLIHGEDEEIKTSFLNDFSLLKLWKSR